MRITGEEVSDRGGGGRGLPIVLDQQIPCVRKGDGDGEHATHRVHPREGAGADIAATVTVRPSLSTFVLQLRRIPHGSGYGSTRASPRR